MGEEEAHIALDAAKRLLHLWRWRGRRAGSSRLRPARQARAHHELLHGGTDAGRPVSFVYALYEGSLLGAVRKQLDRGRLMRNRRIYSPGIAGGQIETDLRATAVTQNKSRLATKRRKRLRRVIAMELHILVLRRTVKKASRVTTRIIPNYRLTVRQ